MTVSMNHKQTGRFWCSATQCLLGGIAVALVTFVCFRLNVSITTAALLYLIVVVLASLTGSFVLSAVVSIIAILCLDYFFTEPLFIIDVTLRNPLDLVALITFLGTALVITSLMAKGRKSFEVLREQASLLNLTHDTVFVRDTSDVITYWNRGAEERYGWKREEAVGKISHQLMQTIFPAPLEEINAELLRTGRWDGELVHTARDGTQVIVASRWSLQRDKQGLPAAILETNNNITEQKRAEEALRQAQAELAHVTRVTTLGELAASIAHEVNQPLSGIITNSNACIRWLAGDSPNLDEAREAIRRILRDGNRASDVISRIRALVSKTDTEKSRLDVNAAIQEVAALAQGEVGRNKVALRTELAHDLPPVLGDRVQLQQVILNLVMNGVEAMASVADRPRELLIYSHQDGSDKILVAVRDSGTELHSENLDRFFEPFFSTKPKGMGMGLAISRSIIESHGGRLWAVPNDGPGVTFAFALPVESASAI